MGCENQKELCIQELGKKDIDPVEKIQFYQYFKLSPYLLRLLV